MPEILIVVAVLAVAGLLLFRFNGAWIYAVWDRATRNSTDRIPPGYDLPRYYRTNSSGDVDPASRWPGWDGWYFFGIPEGGGIPVKMVRASLMTGLYGLDGIDNYERLKFRLSTFDAVEYLALMPMLVKTPEAVEQRNNLSQYYLPRRWHLWLKPNVLDVSITGQRAQSDEEYEEYGRVSGAWPNYRLRFFNPEGDVRADLNFTAEKVVWWADAPGLFTYFSVLGRFEGKLVLGGGSSKPDPHKIPAGAESYNVSGGGALEHGFARKLFGADPLFFPVRILNSIIPSFRPVRYHYETFLGDGGERGGFMHALALGVPVRDRGGFFWNGAYVAIDGVKIAYFDDPAPDLVAANCPTRPPVTFYRKWRVQARTNDGVLEYVGVREFPPATAASHMMYYQFACEGSYKGRSFKGQGYGEYVHI